jgi:creatinine amidohydrolase
MTRQTRYSMLFAVVLFAFLMPSTVSSQAVPGRGASTVAPVLHSVHIEELTWVEVRDAIATGHTTVIVPLAAIEQNGPYMATGKHVYVVKGIAEATARVLGNALVAPVVPIGPGGSVEQVLSLESDPPVRGHMRWPGSMAVRREVYQELLSDILGNLRYHGFLDIVVISEHEGFTSEDSPGPAAETVATVNERWGSGKAIAHFIPEYRDHLISDPRGSHAATFLQDELGVVEKVVDEEIPEAGQNYLLDGRNPVGTHDGYYFSAVLQAVHPATVRAAERIAAGPQVSYGVDWGSVKQLAANGRKLIQYRATAIAKYIRKAIAASR